MNQNPTYEELQQRVTDLEHQFKTVLDVLANYEQLEIERQNAESLLEYARRESQRTELWFKTLFMESPIGMAVMDSITGKIYECNPKFAQISGRSIDDIKKLTSWMSIVVPEDVEKDLANMTRLNGGEIKSFSMEERYIRPDGSTTWINLTVADIPVEKGQNPRHLCMMEDITNRKQAEQDLLQQKIAIEQQNNEYAALNEEFAATNDALKEANLELTQAKEQALLNESRFKSYINHALDGIFISDQYGNYVEVNPAASVITGYSQEELLTMNIAKMTYHEDLDIALQSFQRVQTKGNTSDELRFKRKDGSIGYWIVAATKISDTRFLAITKDTTERKKAEQDLLQQKIAIEQQYEENAALNEEFAATNDALKETNQEIQAINKQLQKAKERAEESEARLKEAQAIAHIGHWYWDYKKSILRWSDEIFNIFGQSKEHFEVSTENFENTIHPADLPMFLQQRQEALASEKNFVITHRIILPDGTIKHVEERAKVIRDRNNNPEALLGTVQDITNIKKYEAELEAAKEKAEESERLKSAFLQNMSHEVRTPMNAICGFAEMLNEPSLNDEKRQEFVNIILRNSQQLLNIITDVLTIASIDAGQQELHPSNTNINKIFDDALAYFSTQITHSKLNITKKYDLSYEEAFVRTDANKLSTILKNLVSNAVKFTHQGSIEVGYTIQNGIILFHVTDTGIGIPLELHEKIFDKFRQGEISLTRRYGGNGLGLSICKAFVEIMGGKIWVQSQIDKGSTFYFTIPFDTIANVNLTTINPAKMEQPTILVAEDEDFNFMYIEELLLHENIKIIRAENGKQAVEIVSQNTDFCLIIMDIKMPVMDGHTAANMIKQIAPKIPIIAYTAYALDNEMQNFATDCFDDYMTKPAKLSELKNKINQYTR